MNLPVSNSSSTQASSNFSLLDKGIQRWIWESGWSELKDAQERAIPVILGADRDVIIAAATASGKTEAAFFPILTRLLKEEEISCALYISPLKALINDQWDRLDRLCEKLEIPVTPWHGDITGARKHRFLKSPQGCLLITPESLEALLMSHGHALAGLLNGLRYIVVDELHAFIGTERGKQLQSLMHRIDVGLKRRIPRIALSATLGDMQMAADFLRPGQSANVELIVSQDNSQELKVIVKGYLDLPPRLSDKEASAHRDVELEDSISQGQLAISEHLFKTLRGSNNLVFPNSRAKVELYSDLLRRRCEREALPNEFWPHHGNLAKDIREETESALKSKERPATAVCTTTLELGIDIGSVKSVAQVGPAPSVASLRQRLGRSGRRKGEPAILRCYALEAEITPETSLPDQLREGLVQTIAQIRLLVRGWYEPPQTIGMHLSTLVQQLLSLIAQYGGLSATDAWQLLCGTGPFPNISKQDFAVLLRELGTRKVLAQTGTGLLLHGGLGERLVNHYTFYAAFSSDEEFRVICAGKTLGTLPLSQPVEPGGYIIFAGRRWQVELLDAEKKFIQVVPAVGGKVPKFEGTGGLVGDEVRTEMRKVLSESLPVPFLDTTAMDLLSEARQTFLRIQLDAGQIVVQGKTVKLFLWKGDRVMDTVALMLRHRGHEAVNEGLDIAVHNVGIKRLAATLLDIVGSNPPAPDELVAKVLNKEQGKWDWLLPESLLCRNFASLNLDMAGAHQAISELLETLKPT